tara:strand:- start:201 stop:845 length:645 start_codon:yes stop_codon:yes gene_type:complete
MTAKIKLNAASGGGSVSLKAPSTTTGNAAVELQLPVDDGSNGQYIKTDGSGNLAFATLPTSGKFASYAIIADQKATDATGGASSTGSFNTRDLNTELADPDGIVSISSNQFTLQAGTYLIKASAPAYNAQRHQIIIWNATDSSVTSVGTSEYAHNAASVQTRSFATGRTTISGAKAFEIRHRVDVADSTFGLGVESNFDTLASIYTIVEIYKEL